MEVAGLALGAAGLIGVIGAFKDAIDLFGLVADSRRLGPDYELLDTKLDIQKTLLLQWADGVKLLDPIDYDKRLDDAQTQRLVNKILGHIRFLLTDTTAMKQRYGLSEASEQDLIQANGVLEHRGVSENRMVRFVQDFENLKLRTHTRQQATSLGKRSRWVIRDKQKFESLVEELAGFTVNLNQLVPNTDDRDSARFMAEEDLKAIRDLKELRLLLQASAYSQKAIAQSTRHAIASVRILDKLWFRKIDDRRESISPSHEATLAWILDPPSGSHRWDDFSEWLRSGSGIYWVSGKAGSGKSTLMKYIYSHDRTRQLLSGWADEDHYSICDFFFSNLGTEEQKSQEGLSRTLLYQILSKHQDLIPEALPHMWKEVQGASAEQSIGFPSPSETRQAFEIIAKSSQKLGRFCFFIDGLDEFVGEYRDGIDLIKDLAIHEHIKIVVSSRPIPECVAAFSNSPMLQLHHLNRADITSYVQHTIAGHAYAEELLSRHSEQAADIVEDLAEKSSGVFLWVVLACRSLLNGLSDHDRISELRLRVEGLPPELDDMFQHMLSKIDERHRGQGSQLLRICHTHLKTERDTDIYALGLALVSDYFDQPVRVRRLSLDTRRRMCRELEGRLRSRCGGLLELVQRMPSVRSDTHCLCRTEECSDLRRHDAEIDSKVVFMHRTVFEFLSSEGVWELEHMRTHNPRFDTATALSLYGLHLAMQTVHSNVSVGSTASFFMQGLKWAAESDMHHPCDPAGFFENLQPFLDALAAGDDGGFISPHILGIGRHPIGTPGSHNVLRIALDTGAKNYVKNHAELKSLATHDWRSCGCWPILGHAVRRYWSANSKDAKTTFSRAWCGRLCSSKLCLCSGELVDLLILSGCSPNENISINSEGTTPWRIWLDKAQSYEHFEYTDALETLSVAQVFLRGGADPQPPNLGLAGWISEVFINNEKNDELVRQKARALLAFIEELRGHEGGGHECAHSATETAPAFEGATDTSRDILFEIILLILFFTVANSII